MKFVAGKTNLVVEGMMVRVRWTSALRIAWTRGAAALLCVLLFMAAIPSASAQQQPAQPPHDPPRPVSLAHLYWHFLVYQNFIDTNAAALDAQGKDGSPLRNHLQARMGFSDADFAPIRASSVRLSSELKALDAQAAAIRATGTSPSNTAQLKALVAQREAYINAEISSLKQALPPNRITAFETFITQFFAPKNVTFKPVVSSGQPAPSAVQP
jgi:hypothetical protein